MDQNEHFGKLSSFINDDYADDWGDDQELWLPEHLISLPDQRWAVWRTITLRGAGFPIAQVLSLAPESGRVATEQLLDAEDRAQQAEDAAAAVVNAALDTLRREDQWHDTARRYPLVQLLRAIRQRKLPPTVDQPAEIKEALDAFRAALVEAEATRAVYRATFEESMRESSQAIRAVAAEDRFREAVIWQNRQAYHTGVLPLQTLAETSRNSKQRQHEELIASYMQRYCAKNDTIGFFGPVGWAQFIPEGPPIRMEPGPGLTQSREVYFEGWAIDTLAETLARNKNLRPWLAPRRTPFAYLEGTMLQMPMEKPTPITPKQAAVLHACDGQRLAREIAAELVRAPDSQISSEAEVYKILEGMHAMGLVVWTLEAPLESRPERTLRRLLERVGDESLRRPALAALTDLESARTAVARAAGNAGQLNQALEQLEATFTRITGAEATRAAGKTYAARTLVYEDCRRNIELELGPAVLDALSEPMSLLLLSARWITDQAATAFREAFKQTHAELAAASGSQLVPALDFWLKSQETLSGENNRIVGQIMQTLQQRWAEILDLPPDRRQVSYTSAELRPKVEAAFGDARAGWSLAHYHSPDVMIAAADGAAIERGDFLGVMGELHVAENTIGAAAFLTQYPNPEDLFQALVQDLPGPRLMPITPRNWHQLTARTRSALVSPWDYRLIFSKDACGVQKSRAVPIGSLVIEPSGDSLTIRTRDSKIQFDIVEALGSLLSNLVANSFRMLQPAPHSPRITIDRLAVTRETWRFAAGEIPFSGSKHDAESFLAAQRWARQHGIPRFVFFKSPIEVKPSYLDF
ncbi:MAG TPA: lantibiotic dehydratase, partial [Herpetosiphonaceae bacterium]